ncbi:MAG TPA: type II secretion system F family protein [Dehalococcoidia bacterium]|nr:type II secretion system F family protein [Dehalococcoidia bacterium]
MEVLALVVVFASIFCLVLGLSMKSENPMSARVATLRGERPAIEFGRERPASLGVRVLGPLGSSLGSSLQGFLPTNMVKGIETKLIRAGEPVTLGGYLAAMVLVELTLISFAFIMLASSGFGGQNLAFMGMAAVFGFLLPKIWLDNRVKHRQKEILKSLPDAFDLITTCVEAGLGLEAALAKVAEKTPGPFGEELAVSLREVSLGKLRRDALKELSERTGVPDLSSFINAVIQAESMGTSIAAVLRVQAEQMRMKRRQRAEQQAQAAPIKMMFPLVLCIFPTLFLVILGPAGIQIYHQLVANGE